MRQVFSWALACSPGARKLIPGWVCEDKLDRRRAERVPWCVVSCEDVAMRAVWITKAAGPEALEVRETADPEPARDRSAFVSARPA